MSFSKFRTPGKPAPRGRSVNQLIRTVLSRARLIENNVGSIVPRQPPPASNILSKVGAFLGFVLYELMFPRKVADATIPDWITDVPAQKTIVEGETRFPDGNYSGARYQVRVDYSFYYVFDPETTIYRGETIIAQPGISGAITGVEWLLVGDDRFRVTVVFANGTDSTIRTTDPIPSFHVFRPPVPTIVFIQVAAPQPGSQPQPIPGQIVAAKGDNFFPEPEPIRDANKLDFRPYSPDFINNKIPSPASKAPATFGQSDIFDFFEPFIFDGLGDGFDITPAPAPAPNPSPEEIEPERRGKTIKYLQSDSNSAFARNLRSIAPDRGRAPGEKTITKFPDVDGKDRLSIAPGTPGTVGEPETELEPVPEIDLTPVPSVEPLKLGEVTELLEQLKTQLQQETEQFITEEIITKLIEIAVQTSPENQKQNAKDGICEETLPDGCLDVNIKQPLEDLISGVEPFLENNFDVLDKLGDGNLEGEEVEEEEVENDRIKWVVVSIVRSPSSGKSILQSNPDNSTFFAGYICFFVVAGGIKYRTVEQPIRKLRNAFIAPRGTKGYNMYAVNGASIRAKVYLQKLEPGEV